MLKKILLIISLSQLVSCASLRKIPQPKTEFRGVWIATVVNIDWPKNGTDAIQKQKADYLRLLDFYKDLHFNAVIVQIRAAGDAFYKSKFAPWSRFLTGEEGKAPSTNDDLLKWMIDQSHLRGMEFHAWLNPYRSTFDLNTDVLSPTHDFNLHPEWMLKYGKKYYYDPGLPEVREHMVRIIDELVATYDIDAIHFDDYFYPYTIKGEVLTDSLSYSYYHQDKSLADWRRSNIDSLVKNVHQTIKSKKPWVQLGISPFGVWKNNSTDPRGSDTQAGQTTYDDLYADPLLWMRQGWLDYLVPQVYWSMDLPVASHKKIVDWWASNSTQTNLYIGNGPYKIRNNSDKAWDNPKELPEQIVYARKTPAINGNVFFSAKSLMQDNNDVVSILKKKLYKYAALPPISKGLVPDATALPSVVSIYQVNESLNLIFNDLSAYRFVMAYPSRKKKKSAYPIKRLLIKTSILEGHKLSLPIKALKGKKNIALIFINHYGQESAAIVVHLNQTNLNDTEK